MFCKLKKNAISAFQYFFRIQSAFGWLNLHFISLWPWTLPLWDRPGQCSGQILHYCTGSRGDVFVVRTSKPVENLWKKWVILIALQFRYTFCWPQTKRLRARKIGLQSFFLLGTPFGRRTVRQREYGLRLLIFKMANNKVDLGQIRGEEIVYSRFIKIPLG